MIQVYYIKGDMADWEEFPEISVSGKEYVDYKGFFASEANGVRGVVYPKYKGEPYNYFNEIKNAILSIDDGGFPYEYEDTFELREHTVEEVVQEMAKLGFEMIEFIP